MKLKQLLLPAFGAALLTTGMVWAQTPMAPPVPAQAPAAITIFGGGTYLGVFAEDVDKETAQRLSLREQRGVVINRVTEDSPAAKAGLQKDDVITRFDGENVTTMRKLSRLIEESAPEQQVRLKILRNGQEKEINVTLSARRSALAPGAQVWEWNGNDAKALEELRGQVGKAGGNLAFAFGARRRIGVSTDELTEQLGEYFGVTGKGGLLITSVEKDSPAAKAGLKAGDVIIEADNTKLDDSGDLVRAINKQEEGDVTLTILRNRSQQTLRVTPEKLKTPEGSGFFAPGRLTGTINTAPRIAPRIIRAPGRIL